MSFFTGTSSGFGLRFLRRARMPLDLVEPHPRMCITNVRGLVSPTAGSVTASRLTFCFAAVMPQRRDRERRTPTRRSASTVEVAPEGDIFLGATSGGS